MDMAVEQAKDVTTVFVTDPDTDNEVELCVFKDSGGGIFAVDLSFIDQVSDVVPNPLQNGSLIHLTAGELVDEANPKDHDLFLINHLLYLFVTLADRKLVFKVLRQAGLSKDRGREVFDRAERNAADILNS